MSQAKPSLLEAAQSGKIEAISALLNRTLKSKNISASVSSQDGVLEVMLDGDRIPPESASAFIENGIRKLDIDSIYDLRVYGRKLGEPFATWHHHQALKVRPFEPIKSKGKLTDRKAESGGSGIKILNSSGEDIEINIVQVVGFVGVALTIAGIFSPMMTIPIVGTVDYMRGGSEEAVSLLLLSFLSIFFLIKKRYEWLYGSGIWAFLLVLTTCIYYQSRISEAVSAFNREMRGNPFRGLGDLAMANMGLSWGWFLLFSGTGLLVYSAYLNNKRVTREVWRSLVISPLIVIAAVVALGVTEAVGDGFRLGSENLGQATRARESEARTYIGSINRGQQAFRLENPEFSPDVDQLGLGVQTETDFYQYEVTESSDEMTTATATAKARGLRSMRGAVFVVQDGDGASTTRAVICATNRASRTPPDLPTVSRLGELQCASGSSEE